MVAGNDRVADIDFRNKMREHLSPEELQQKIKEVSNYMNTCKYY